MQEETSSNQEFEMKLKSKVNQVLDELKKMKYGDFIFGFEPAPNLRVVFMFVTSMTALYLEQGAVEIAKRIFESTAEVALEMVEKHGVIPPEMRES